MHVDISRDTFDPASQFLRVIQEQGGVVLDADANEQTAILFSRLHELAADVLGSHWGPGVEAGFNIEGNSDKGYTASAGRYYVGGRLVRNAKPRPVTLSKADLTGQCLVYLDVWERLVNEAERQTLDPPLPAREPGLGEVPAAPRTMLAWRVRRTPGVKIKAAVNALQEIKLPQVPEGADVTAEALGLLKSALGALLGVADADTDLLRQRLVEWYDSARDQAQEWYRQRMRTTSVFVGAAMCFALNIDSIEVADRLYRDANLRAVVIARGQAIPGPVVQGKEPTPEQKEVAKTLLESFQFGWGPDLNQPASWDAIEAKCKKNAFFGIIITTLAISMGAPFWYSIVGRIQEKFLGGDKPPADKSGTDDAKK